MLITELKGHTAAHSSSAKRNKLFAGKLGTIGRLEHFTPMQKHLASIGNAFTSVANNRVKFLGNEPTFGGDVLLNRLNKSKSDVLDPTIALLSDRSSKVKQVEKELTKYIALQNKAGKAASLEAKKISKESPGMPHLSPEEADKQAKINTILPQTLLDAKDGLASCESVVDTNVLAFESQRIADLMCITEDLIRREIAWHAKSIEILYPLINKIRSMDPEAAVEELRERLNQVKLNAEERELEENHRLSVDRRDEAAEKGREDESSEKD